MLDHNTNPNSKPKLTLLASFAFTVGGMSGVERVGGTMLSS